MALSLTHTFLLHLVSIAMDRMFRGASAFNQNMDEWGKLDKVTRMNGKCRNNSSLEIRVEIVSLTQAAP